MVEIVAGSRSSRFKRYIHTVYDCVFLVIPVFIKKSSEYNSKMKRWRNTKREANYFDMASDRIECFKI